MKKPQKSVQEMADSAKENTKEFSGENKRLSYLLAENIVWFKETFGQSTDFILREFQIGEKAVALGFFDGMIDKRLLNEDVIKTLQQSNGAEIAISDIANRLLAVGELKESAYLNELAKGILDGDGVLLVDGIDRGLIIAAKGWATRAIGQSTNESSLRGAQEAFTENIVSNFSMLRRRLHTDKFTIKVRTIGTMTKTKVALAYIDGIVNPQIVAELNRRLDAIKEVDSIIDSGCLEQYIEDGTYSPFPQMQYTQKPDRVAANLLEGRVALLLDGCPEVLIVPVVLVQFFQSSEDYYNRLLAGSFARFIRYIGLMIAVVLPALYIAVTSYHQEMLSGSMALSIAAAREGKPFPAFLEAIIMELMFELLREASIRLPGTISNALGIVGALVIGQAAVEAQLIAPQVVIVVALTAIGTFTMPSFEISYPLRLVRFPLMLLAAWAGLYGLAIGLIFLLIHLVSLKSLGEPYLAPLAPFNFYQMKDVLIRAPRWQMMTNPQFRPPTEDIPHGFWQREFLKVKDKSNE